MKALLSLCLAILLAGTVCAQDKPPAASPAAGETGVVKPVMLNAYVSKLTPVDEKRFVILVMAFQDLLNNSRPPDLPVSFVVDRITVTQLTVGSHIKLIGTPDGQDKSDGTNTLKLKNVTVSVLQYDPPEGIPIGPNGLIWERPVPVFALSPEHAKENAKCPVCNGTGKRRMSKTSKTLYTCTACGGTGKRKAPAPP